MKAFLRDVGVIYAIIIACALFGACRSGPSNEDGLLEGVTFTVVASDAATYTLRRVDDGAAHDAFVVRPRRPPTARVGECLKTVKGPDGARLETVPCPTSQP